MENEQNLALEASDEAVPQGAQIETSQSEQVDPDKGETQSDAQSAEGKDLDAEGSEADEKVSRAKARREKRKAEYQAVVQERDTLKSAVAEKDARIAELEQSHQAQPPQQKDFENYDDYLAALSAFRSMQAMDDREAKRLKAERDQTQGKLTQAEAREQQEIARNMQEQAEEARTRYADFDAVVNAPDLRITPEMARMVGTSDFAADVAYHLGTNKAEAARIASMNPVEQARAIGAIEARIAMQVQQPRTTKAPDPTQPVKPKATARLDPSKMSMAEYVAARKAGRL